MKQMNIDTEQIVQVEYTGAAIALKPVVFKDGDSYCCILGPDPQQGIFGCGDTPEEALSEWEAALQARLKNANQDDEVVKLVMGIISKKSTSSTSNIQDFYDQFRPLTKK
jgi:hypothetical protein